MLYRLVLFSVMSIFMQYHGDNIEMRSKSDGLDGSSDDCSKIIARALDDTYIRRLVGRELRSCGTHHRSPPS